MGRVNYLMLIAVFQMLMSIKGVGEWRRGYKGSR